MRGRKSSARWRRGLALVLLGVVLAAPAAWGETCSTADDMDPATRSALEQTARQYFGYLARGDAAGLKLSAIPSVAANFHDIETAVKDHKDALALAQPSVRSSFLLEAEGQGTLERAEFLCGIFGAETLTPYSVVFVLNNLPVGRYAVVILDAKIKDGGSAIAYVLQQEAAANGRWRLAGMYITATQVGEHDGQWFWQQAKAYQAKGQLHNAWFYYGLARQLLAPVNFMTTLDLEKIYDAQQKVAPPDMPAGGFELAAEGRSFRITQIFPAPDTGDAPGALNLVADYQASDVSNQQQAYLDNLAVIRALAAKYPEFKDGFAGLAARAVDHAGRSFGTLVGMKDLK